MRAIQHRTGTYHRETKKIRGGKRHLKRLRQESTWAPSLHEEALRHYHYAHEKLGLYPWHWHHRQPPLRVRQLAVQHLLTTFFAWQKQLVQWAEPHYLAIWIVEPEFAHSSQVVATIKERSERYQATFSEATPNGPPLPALYAALPGADTLTWHTYPWEAWHDADDYPDGWPDRLLTLPHYEYEYPGSGLYLVVQTGWMWVGMMPKPAA